MKETNIKDLDSFEKAKMEAISILDELGFLQNIFTQFTCFVIGFYAQLVDKIGCIHTCQGIDLDYCGVIIGKDITYENGKIIFHKDAHPTSDQAGIRTANDINAETWIKNTYYVLLTRGILGTFVYCEDDGLRDYLKSKLITK